MSFSRARRLLIFGTAPATALTTITYCLTNPEHVHDNNLIQPSLPLNTVHRKHSYYSFGNRQGPGKYRLRVTAASIPKVAKDINDVVVVDSIDDDDDDIKNVSFVAGEDAFCIGRDGVGAVWMAVADGVGGWTKKGIDPSKFSGSLTRHLTKIVDSLKLVSPVSALRIAYNDLINDWKEGKDKPFGSSTACLVKFTMDGELRTCNLGDSGYVVIRPEQDGIIVDASLPQQSRFNCPNQLRLTPEGKYEDITNTSTCKSLSIKPLHFIRSPTSSLREGDYVVVGSDGLFDNLFPQDITDIVSEANHRHDINVAVELAMAAYEASIDVDRDCPFNAESRRAGMERKGGKPDDITVLVGVIEKAV